MSRWRTPFAASWSSARKQVLTEALQFVVTELALAAQPSAEGLLTRVIRLQDRTRADLAQALPAQLDHRAASDQLQGALLRAQPVGLLLVEGHLEDTFFDADRAVVVLHGTLHEQCAGSGARAEDPAYRPLGIQGLTGQRLQRVDGQGGLGVGDDTGPFRLVEEVQELLRGTEPVVDVGTGGFEDQGVECVGDTVGDREQVQARLGAQALLEDTALWGRGLAGQDQIGNGTQTKDVQVPRVGNPAAKKYRNYYLMRSN